MWGVPPAVVSTPVRCEIALSRYLNLSVFVSQEDMASAFVFDEQSKLECKNIFIRLLNNRDLEYEEFMSCVWQSQVAVFEELRREVDRFGQPIPLALTEPMEEEEEELSEAEEVQRVVREIKVLPPADQKEVLDALPLTVMRQSTNEMSVGRSKQLYAQNTKVGVFHKHQEKKHTVTVSAEFPSGWQGKVETQE